MNPVFIVAGVVDQNKKAFELGQHIWNQGKDLVADNAEKEFRQRIQSELEDYDQSDGKESLLKLLASVLRQADLDRLTPELVFDEFVDPESLTFDISEIIDHLQQEWYDRGLCEIEEPEYELLEDGQHYKVFWLQCPLIRVIKSDFYTLCRMCSPCCPNQGDLDSEYHELDTVHAYCPPPGEWEHGTRPIWRVSDNELVSGQP